MAYPLFSIGKGRGVTVGATSTLVLAANTQRVFARLTNDSTEPIYLMLGNAAKMNSGIRLEKSALTNNFWEINNTNLYNGSIYAICNSGSKVLLVMEDAPSTSFSSCSSSLSSSSSSFSSSSSSFSSSSCSSSFSSSSSCSSCSSSFSSSSSSSCSSSFSSSSSSFSSSSSYSSSCSSSLSFSSSSSSGSCATGVLVSGDTGLKSPTSEGSVWNNWYQAENAYTDDVNYASATLGDTQDYGTFTLGV